MRIQFIQHREQRGQVAAAVAQQVLRDFGRQNQAACLRVLLQVSVRQIRDFGLRVQFYKSDRRAFPQVHSRGGGNPSGSEARTGEQGGQEHRKAAGLRCADQFFGVRSFA